MKAQREAIAEFIERVRQLSVYLARVLEAGATRVVSPCNPEPLARFQELVNQGLAIVQVSILVLMVSNGVVSLKPFCSTSSRCCCRCTRVVASSRAW